jgi:ribosome-associated translation inhibitor RaiA
MTHARVTLTKSAHHRHGDRVAEAHVVLTLPRKHVVTARKERKSFEEAIRASFSAVDQDLKRFREKRADVGTRAARDDANS